MPAFVLHHVLASVVITVLVLLAIRGLSGSGAPVNPPAVTQSAAGPVVIALAGLAAVVIWVKSRGHQAAHIVHAAPAAPRHIVTHTVIRHAASHAGLTWPEAAVVIVFFVLGFVFWLNQR